MPRIPGSRAKRRSAPRLRRTPLVWGSLLAGMTIVGSVLLLLDGQPAPRMDGLALASPVPAAGATPIEAIFNTRQPIEKGRWDGVIIHHSGAAYGSAGTIAAEHQSRRLHGLGHHFVIGNGEGADDGGLHVGYRWLDQLAGAHTGGPDEDRYNRRYVGICLVGDGDRHPFTPAQVRRLAQLVLALQRRLDLPPDSIRLHSDVTATSSPGRFFSLAEFRRMLAAGGNGR